MPKGQPGTRSPHGTLSRYTQDCRCRKCKNAMAEWRRAKYGYRTIAEHLAEIEPPHGTESRYNSPRFRCGCDVCREASRVARAERRVRAATA